MTTENATTKYVVMTPGFEYNDEYYYTGDYNCLHRNRYYNFKVTAEAAKLKIWQQTFNTEDLEVYDTEGQEDIHVLWNMRRLELDYPELAARIPHHGAFEEPLSIKDVNILIPYWTGPAFAWVEEIQEG